MLSIKSALSILNNKTAIKDKNKIIAKKPPINKVVLTYLPFFL